MLVGLSVSSSYAVVVHTKALPPQNSFAPIALILSAVTSPSTSIAGLVSFNPES